MASCVRLYELIVLWGLWTKPPSTFLFCSFHFNMIWDRGGEFKRQKEWSNGGERSQAHHNLERARKKYRERGGKIVINGDSVIFQNPKGTGPSCREKADKEERNFVCMYVCVCWWLWVLWVTECKNISPTCSPHEINQRKWTEGSRLTRNL